MQLLMVLGGADSRDRMYISRHTSSSVEAAALGRVEKWSKLAGDRAS